MSGTAKPEDAGRDAGEMAQHQEVHNVANGGDSCVSQVKAHGLIIKNVH